MQNYISEDNEHLNDRVNLFLSKEYALNKSFFYKIKNNHKIYHEYFNLLRLSYLIGEPFYGNFGLRNIIFNLSIENLHN